MQKRINTRFDAQAALFIQKTNAALDVTPEELADIAAHPEKYEPLRPARRFKKRLKNIAENLGRQAAEEVRRQKKLSIEQKRTLTLKPFGKPLATYARNSH